MAVWLVFRVWAHFVDSGFFRAGVRARLKGNFLMLAIRVREWLER